MSSVIVQSGNNSATFAVDPIPDGVSPSGYIYGYLQKPDWEALPNGRLKDLLNRSYGPVSTPEELEASSTAFLAAFFAAGGQVVAAARADRPAKGVIENDAWLDLDVTPGNEGYPAVGISPLGWASSALPSFVRVSLAYSASE